MNKALDKLPDLVEEELEAANKEHPPFHSIHEGYAVLLEEHDETRTAFFTMGARLSDIWEDVKKDDVCSVLDSAYSLRLAAVEVAAEAIQVAAMACKLIDFIEKEATPWPGTSTRDAATCAEHTSPQGTGTLNCSEGRQ